MRNSYYRICPNCGCSLDPCETCTDCFPKDNIPYPNAKHGEMYKKLLNNEKCVGDSKHEQINHSER